MVKIVMIKKYLQNTNNVIAKSAIVAYLQKTTLKHQSLHHLNLKAKLNVGFHNILKSANIYLNEQEKSIDILSRVDTISKTKEQNKEITATDIAEIEHALLAKKIVLHSKIKCR